MRPGATPLQPQGTRRLRGPLFLLLLWLATLAAAVDFPPLSGRVNDYANLLSPGARTELTERLARHEWETSNQVVVVTLATLDGLPIEDYGYQLGRAWGIGQAKRNNGVLLIVAPNERKVRIEVGYGLEGTLTDVQSHTIIQNVIIPRFRQGDFEAGIVDGAEALLGTLTGTYEPLPSPAPEAEGVGKLESAISLGMFALVFGQALTYRLRPRALGATLVGGGTAALIWILLGVVGLALGVGVAVALLHLLSGGGRGRRPGRGGRGGYYGGLGGGGFSRGGWGGSGGGFSGGGGSFGGGGASGSW